MTLKPGQEKPYRLDPYPKPVFRSLFAEKLTRNASAEGCEHVERSFRGFSLRKSYKNLQNNLRTPLNPLKKTQENPKKNQIPEILQTAQCDLRHLFFPPKITADLPNKAKQRLAEEEHVRDLRSNFLMAKSAARAFRRALML